MARQELCFIGFPIVLLTESFNNGQNYQEKLVFFPKGALSAFERRKVRYFINSLDFLKKNDFSTISSLPLSPSPNSAFSAIFIDANKFSADLVVELVPLSISASSALSLTLTSFWLIWL